MQERVRQSDHMDVWTPALKNFRRFALLVSAIAVAAPCEWATTLEQLTLDDMARQSTSIIRAKVTGSHSGLRSGNVYTYFELQVMEHWKGEAVAEVAVPGGAAGGIRQSVSGAPQLKSGQEYILFLWTSRSGLTQLIGLSQGIFQVSGEGSGEAVAQRPAASELMLSRSGRPVQDRAVNMPLHDLRARVREALLSPAQGVLARGAAK